MTQPPSTVPADYLMEFILSVLTPLLMNSAFCDIQLARLAATQTLAAYKASSAGQLVTVAQIVAFALTALDNLRLSATPDVSLTMKLKLRGSANALSRSAHHATERLEKAHSADPSPAPGWMEPPAPAPQHPAVSCPASPQASPQTAEPAAMNTPAKPDPAERQNRLDWAATMKTEAEKLRHSATDVSPAQQNTNRLWAEVLTDVANELTQAKRPLAGPGMSRSTLMRTTLLTSDPSFPAHFLTGRQPSVATQKRKP